MIAAIKEDSMGDQYYPSWKLTTNKAAICDADDRGEALFVSSLEELSEELEIRNPAPPGLYFVIPIKTGHIVSDDDDYDFEDYDIRDDAALPHSLASARISVSDIPLANELEVAIHYSDKFDEIGVDYTCVDEEFRPKYYSKRYKEGSSWVQESYHAAVVEDDLYLDAQTKHVLSGYGINKTYYILKKDAEIVKKIKKISKKRSNTTENNEKRRLKRCCLSAQTLKNLHKGMISATAGFELDSAVPVGCKKDEVIKRLGSLYTLCKRLKREYRDLPCGKLIRDYNRQTRGYDIRPRPSVIELIRSFYPFTKSLLQHSNPDYVILGKWFAYEQKKDRKLAKEAAKAAEAPQPQEA